MAEANPTGRIARLDALRALGCIAVLVAHCFIVVPWVSGYQVSAIKLTLLLFNGHMAVTGFFVMSGYVLGLSLDQGAGRPGNFSRFYFRRVFRIYPAHVITIGFISVAFLLFDHTVRPPGASDMYVNLFPFTHMSLVDRVLNALLLRPEMNGIVWTLAVEVAAAIVFPLLYLASRHSSPWVRAGVLLALIWVSAAVGNRILKAGLPMSLGANHPFILKVLTDLWYVPAILHNIVKYCYVFYVGLVAEPIFKRLVPRIDGRIATWLVVFGWVIAVLPMFRPGTDWSRPTPPVLFLQVCGATILVFCTALMQTRNRFIRMLDHPFFNRLGEITYSFYLYHLIVLYFIANVMFRLMDPTLVSAYPLPFVLALTVFAFPATAAIATVSYRLIELPMIAYSKRRTRSRRAPTLARAIAASEPA